MIVKFKKLHPDAKKPFKTYDDDFCYDVVATSCEKVAPNVYKYGLGLAFEIFRDPAEPYMAYMEREYRGEYNGYGIYFDTDDFDNRRMCLSIDFRSRSSVWKTGMVLSNCEGTIDELYRGEVSAVFYHVMPNMPKYEVGDKIGQIKLGLTLPIDFVEASELDKTERGDGAYGSTGK